MIKDEKMIKALAKKLQPFRKEIVSFENKDKGGVVLLDKKQEATKILIDKIYHEAHLIIKAHKNDNIEVNEFIKEALKLVIFAGAVGVVLVQKERIVVRGELNKESVEDLASGIFQSEDNYNEFIYKATTEYMGKKVNIEFLATKTFFDMSAIFKIWMSFLIDKIKKDSELQVNIKSTSINLSEISKPASKSYDKLKNVVTFMLKSSMADTNSPFYHSLADFLLKNLAKANSMQLKYAKEYFDVNLKKVKSNKRLNFALIRRNTTEREKHLVFIEDAKEKIKEAKDKEFDYVKTAEEAAKRMKKFEAETKVARENLEEVLKLSKETFQKREVIRKKPKGAATPEYRDLSEQIRNLTMKKSTAESELKKIKQKYELAKQTIENANEDRADYKKLLPEMLEVQNKKIRDHEGSLREFEDEYKEAKSTIVETLTKSRRLKI